MRASNERDIASLSVVGRSDSDEANLPLQKGIKACEIVEFSHSKRIEGWVVTTLVRAVGAGEDFIGFAKSSNY